MNVSGIYIDLEILNCWVCECSTLLYDAELFFKLFDICLILTISVGEFLSSTEPSTFTDVRLLNFC